LARQAIDKYQEALKWMRQPRFSAKQEKPQKFSLMVHTNSFVKEPFEESDALHYIAQIHAQIGEYYQALNYYNQTLAKIRENKTRTNIEEVALLIAIADLYKDLGDLRQARSYYEQALSMSLKKQRRQQR
jgi:tetratricopeptide (TPR) repeat protein